MSIRLKVGAVTLLVTAITYPVTFLVWPREVPAYAPATAQALGYGLVAAESIAMGGGVAFLIFGYPSIMRLPVSPSLAFFSYLAISFYLLNWWTHDHLHVIASTLSFDGWLRMTIALEYFFHAGMMIFGVVLALFFVRILVARSTKEPSADQLVTR